MKEYFMLMRGGDARMANFSEAESKQHMEDWNVYMGKVAGEGKLVGGMPLQQDGRLITKSNQSEGVVTSDPNGAIGGWLHIKAENYDEAARIAADCPLLTIDGHIELREVAPMDM